MACFRPVSIGTKPDTTEPQVVGCGRCLGCLLDRARAWTVRCSHEYAMHDDSMFLTLTYDDDHLPFGSGSMPTLWPDHLRNFWKRYRKAIAPVRISYFAAGEYGSKTQRPHYHALVFGHCVSDLVPFSERNGNMVFTSEFLRSLWTHGNVVVGDVTPQSIAYTARYCVDKLHARVSDPEYAASGRIPEFVRMSRNPAIGLRFYRKFYKQFLATDSAHISGGFRAKLPRYYDKLYSRFFGYLDSSDFVFGRDSILDVDLSALDFSPEVIKARRVERAALEFFEDSLPPRLRAREEVAKARYNQRPEPVF